MACIEARGLRKVFGSVIALDGVDLRVEEGRIRFARSAVQAVLSAPKERGDSVSELKGEPKATSV